MEAQSIKKAEFYDFLRYKKISTFDQLNMCFNKIEEKFNKKLSYEGKEMLQKKILQVRGKIRNLLKLQPWPRVYKNYAEWFENTIEILPWFFEANNDENSPNAMNRSSDDSSDSAEKNDSYPDDFPTQKPVDFPTQEPVEDVGPQKKRKGDTDNEATQKKRKVDAGKEATQMKRKGDTDDEAPQKKRKVDAGEEPKKRKK